MRRVAYWTSISVLAIPLFLGVLVTGAAITTPHVSFEKGVVLIAPVITAAIVRRLWRNGNLLFRLARADFYAALLAVFTCAAAEEIQRGCLASNDVAGGAMQAQCTTLGEQTSAVVCATIAISWLILLVDSLGRPDPSRVARTRFISVACAVSVFIVIAVLTSSISARGCVLNGRHFLLLLSTTVPLLLNIVVIQLRFFREALTADARVAAIQPTKPVTGFSVKAWIIPVSISVVFALTASAVFNRAEQEAAEVRLELRKQEDHEHRLKQVAQNRAAFEGDLAKLRSILTRANEQLPASRNADDLIRSVTSLGGKDLSATPQPSSNPEVLFRSATSPPTAIAESIASQRPLLIALDAFTCDVASCVGVARAPISHVSVFNDIGVRPMPATRPQTWWLNFREWHRLEDAHARVEQAYVDKGTGHFLDELMSAKQNTEAILNEIDAIKRDTKLVADSAGRLAEAGVAKFALSEVARAEKGSTTKLSVVTTTEERDKAASCLTSLGTVRREGDLIILELPADHGKSL